MYLFPVAVDSYKKWPCTFNYLIIAINIILFLLVFFGYLSQESFILNQTDGFIAHGFMHADWMHLLGNMFYLWLFGNVLCSHIGGLKYVLLYFCFMIGAAVLHVIVDGDRALGASGAISGVLGMVFLLAPNAKVHVVGGYYPMIGRDFSDFRMPAQWIIGTWFLYDIYGAMYGTCRIAYMAHVGGFLTGLLLAWYGLRMGWLEVQPEYDEFTATEIAYGKYEDRKNREE